MRLGLGTVEDVLGRRRGTVQSAAEVSGCQARKTDALYVSSLSACAIIIVIRRGPGFDGTIIRYPGPLFSGDDSRWCQQHQQTCINTSFGRPPFRSHPIPPYLPF